MTTGTQGHKYNGDAGGTGGYINDDRDTGNIRLAITINKAQGQSLEQRGIDLNTDCFSHGQLYVACSRVGKPDNLFICTDNGTAKNVVYSQVLQTYIYLSIFTGGTQGHNYNGV